MDWWDKCLGSYLLACSWDSEVKVWFVTLWWATWKPRNEFDFTMLIKKNLEIILGAKNTIPLHKKEKHDDKNFIISRYFQDLKGNVPLS